MLKPQLIEFFGESSEKLPCALSDNRHLTRKMYKIKLECGHSLCLTCLPNEFTSIQCKICNEVSLRADIDDQIIANSKSSFKACLSIIFHTLEKETFFPESSNNNYI